MSQTPVTTVAASPIVAVSSTAPATATPATTVAPPSLIETVDCADVDLFLQNTHAARLAAAGGPTTPAPSPTRPPPEATAPPLGQYLLATSPVATYTQVGYAGFLRTWQDLGGLSTGQFPELAVKTMLLWGYDRTWTAPSGPGGFQNYVYEFASSAGAVEFDEDAARNACLNGGSLFEVPGIPGAIGQR